MLATNQPDATDGLDVLTKVGGYELGAIAGLIIGAAHSHCLVILDGFNTAAAALIATTICPQAREYIMASHIGGEAGHPIALQKLGLQPIMKLDIKLGEAIGSSLAADLLINGLAACLNVLKSDVEKFAYVDRVQDIMNQHLGLAAGIHNVGILHGILQFDKFRGDFQRNGIVLLFDYYFHNKPLNLKRQRYRAKPNGVTNTQSLSTYCPAALPPYPFLMRTGSTM